MPLAHRPSRPRSNGRGNRAPFLLRTEDYRAGAAGVPVTTDVGNDAARTAPESLGHAICDALVCLVWDEIPHRVDRQPG